MKTVTLRLSPKQAADEKTYTAVAARMAGVQPHEVRETRIVKRSIDARGAGVKVNMSVEIHTNTDPQPAKPRFDYPNVSTHDEVVIVGAGPAGLFCALRLIELGLKPVIVERGKPVSERKRDIAQINRGAAINPDSNYAFGEGGAGTFSDGKLFTRSKKRGDYDRALQTLVHHGADPRILWDAHPHIGTDRLPRIISRIRESIETAGGRVLFNTRVTGLVVKDGRATGVVCHNGTQIEGRAVVLATGHSAHDVYQMLGNQGIALEAKPFAMGVRIEHPQSLIDSIQYHRPEGRGEFLPAASYSLVEQVAGRGVWSFCMCPGGFIVPASTMEGECVVNGMSPSERSSPWANSGIVTEIKPTDWAFLTAEHGALAGLELQRRFEVAAFEASVAGGAGHKAPAQRVADFVFGGGRSERSTTSSGKTEQRYVARRAGAAVGSAAGSTLDACDTLRSPSNLVSHASSILPQTSYVPGLTPSNLGEWMPGFITESLRNGLKAFGRRMRGFVTNEAVLVGVESRTSTPVRIPRNADTLEHVSVRGLYPAGEGAGYAGGIISAALDGQRIAEAVCRGKS